MVTLCQEVRESHSYLQVSSGRLDLRRYALCSTMDQNQQLTKTYFIKCYGLKPEKKVLLVCGELYNSTSTFN